MTPAEIVAKIRADGGAALETYVSPRRADGTRTTIWGDVLSVFTWLELRKLWRDLPEAVPAAALSAGQRRSIAEADASAEPRRRRR